MMILTMSKSNAWTKIMTYVAETQIKMAQEARMQNKLARRAKDRAESDAC